MQTNLFPNKDNLIRPDPVARFAITWIMMLPLAYFASSGAFWFLSVSNNSDLSQMDDAINGASNPTTNIAIAAIIFAIAFAVMVPHTRRVFLKAYTEKVFICLALLALLSSFWSQFPSKTVQYALCLIACTLFAFFLNQRFTHCQFLQVMFLFGWICMGFSFVLIFFFPAYGIDHTMSSIDGWRGMYSQKNACAGMTVTLLPIALNLPVASSLGRLSQGLYVVLSIVLIVGSQSATGKLLLVCLIADTIMLKNLQKLQQKDRFALSFFAALICLPFGLIAFIYFDRISNLLGKDPSLTGRTNIWAAAMTSILKKPLTGYGYMAFSRGLSGESANIALATHWTSVTLQSGFLDTWLTVGLAGILLIAYSLVRALRHASSVFFMAKNSFVIWCISTIFLVLGASIGETGTLLAPNSLVWILYIVACVGLSDVAIRSRMGGLHEEPVG